MNKHLPSRMYSSVVHKKRVLKFILIFSFFLLLDFFASAQVEINIVGISPTCSGYTTGSLVATPSGGSGPYNFTWSTGVTTYGVTSSGLYGISTGTYSVTVVDMASNQASASYTLTSPEPINAELVFSSCNWGGDISINVSGGTYPYTFLWDNGQTSETATGFSSGLHCVTITDANLCESVFCDILYAPLALELDVNGSYCVANSVDAIVTGGNQPYDYAWSNGWTSSSLLDVPTGTYTVTITDENGCTIEGSAEVGASSVLDVQIETVSPVCENDPAGSATLVVSGGSPPYNYNWSTGDTGYFITGVTAGEYSVTVSDANSCSTVTSVLIVALNPIDVEFEITDAYCGNQGSAVADVSGSSSTLNFSWSTGATGNGIHNLSAGSYSVTITANSGCSEVFDFDIESSSGDFSCDAFVVSGISIENASDGEVSVNVFGGSPPYFYQWNTGESTEVISGLGAGEYTVTVTDGSGCSTSCFIELFGVGVSDFTINISFTGFNTIAIEWMASNMNEQYFWEFVVEYSVDGINFSEIGTVSQINTVNGWNAYNLLYEKPGKGHSFYRVKLVKNGQDVSMSNTVHLSRFEEGESVLVFPNPVETVVSFDFLNSFEEKTEAYLYNAQGGLIKKIEIEKDAFRFTVDMVAFPTGLYFVYIDGRKIYQVSKF